MAAVVLSACGGQDEPETPAAAPDRQRASSAGAFVTTDGPQVNGEWSAVGAWPLIAIHAVLMPDGRVMTYGTNGDGRQTGRFIYDVWDSSTQNPATGHQTLPNTTITDFFCSSAIVLPVGTPTVSIVGGDNWTGFGTTNTGNNNSNVFDLATNALTPGPNMNRARWYATSITLPNGETYIQGGTGGTDRPEIRQSDGSFRLLSTDTSVMSYYYPRNFVAPDGRVFGYDAVGKMYFVDALGTGVMTRLGRLDVPYRGKDSTAAMYRPGHILQFGGAADGAATIDITSSTTPVVTATDSLSTNRSWVTGTILANGTVLATGGSEVYNKLTGVSYAAEIWDPRTGRWTLGATANRARLYHSTALLLPDASVLVAGGGAPGPQVNTNAEIFRPPYLFDGDGNLAPRPTIASAPGTIDIGKSFRISTADNADVSRVVLIKTGTVTHSFNFEQRFMDLTYRQDGSDLLVQAPTRGTDATPGYYMLFVFDGNGVPSVARIVQVGLANAPGPDAPSIVAVPAQASDTGVDVSLPVSASDPNGDTLTYGAASLPPGLSIDPATGIISGAPTQGGTFHVVVTADDGVNVSSTAFVWNVSAVEPLALESLSLPAPVVNNGTASFSASATGINVRYRWHFGDGSPDTEWSSSGDVTHTYSQPGTYNVTLSVIDDRNVELRRSFVQAVYLPATANAPSSSGNMLFETRAAGNARVWVVNQDNDSVSVLDAVTSERLREVPVGVAPRALARAADGSIWVTNKQSATISVIDAETLAVSRTIALPRASQPFGVAMSPTSARAFVALEALGQVVQIDTATDALLGTAAVGDYPRHVSVTADGSKVLVSRFITPPMPGEATRVVDTPDTSGGLVVALDAATLATTGTTVLRHSNEPDSASSGSGIPNYLAAAVISPDGTQAWVPSKQDNIKRGKHRNDQDLNFQNTVRAISSRIDMATGLEDFDKRVDHDNSSLGSAAAYDPRGVYLFVALETSREVAVVDAHGGFERMRFTVGLAPQGLAVSADGTTLFVNNFMDRTVGVYDLRPLIDRGEINVPALATVSAVEIERLDDTLLRGKRLFYDARDPRLSLDAYMSCATCHNDGGHDGRTWDLTGFGEGLRNTASLRGRGGAQGLLHWSGNFDEVQDFEGQIRSLAGGTGLMDDAAYFAGTRNQPLGDPKTGQSPDLDALAAYVASLQAFDPSPFRPGATTLSSAAQAGRSVFQARNCASCHGGTAFTSSGSVAPPNIGTIKASSGSRLGGALTGIDIPTLRDVWATAPYLHDGSAATLGDAVRAHNGMSISDTDLANLTAYLREIGSDEANAPEQQPVQPGAGLLATYYNNRDLQEPATLVRTEAVNFNWTNRAPAPGINKDLFSVRWEGFVQATTAGNYVFQTISDDGVRLWVNGVLVVDNWTIHDPVADNSPSIALTAGQRVSIKMEYFENKWRAQAALNWLTPGSAEFTAIPAAQLYVSASEGMSSALRRTSAKAAAAAR